MKNIKLHYRLLFALSSICLKSFAQGPPPTNSVTITPTSNTTEVKGNIKASGLIEANSLKAAGLATGNPYLANPVYANVYGDLVTGYKTGFYSIPPSAFHYNVSIYNDQSIYFPPYFIFYSGSSMLPYLASNSFGFLTPIQIPQQSKLVNLKLKFSFGGTTPKSIQINLQKVSIDGSLSENIVLMNAPTSANSEITTANIPINLVEIDNENYFYSLIILAVEDWSLFKLYGTSIEYRDM